MIDDSKITEAINAYIGYPKEVDEGVEVSMRRDAFKAGVEWFKNALWHDTKEEPKIDKPIIIQYASLVNGVSYDRNRHIAEYPWERHVENLNILKWCYIDDLLPKGGEG